MFHYALACCSPFWKSSIVLFHFLNMWLREILLKGYHNLQASSKININEYCGNCVSSLHNYIEWIPNTWSSSKKSESPAREGPPNRVIYPLFNRLKTLSVLCTRLTSLLCKKKIITKKWKYMYIHMGNPLLSVFLDTYK